ncbi:hypothetical protein [Acetobacterium wieringae]|uniref:hypothetical protein n=1 Tax=Acetobacterium wieringae TaxID=52694 RepID=UPI0026EF0188|nr:hypothetical protein [Acetobacterium wieringae]
MSLFSQRIEELIVDSGETVQDLAEIGKINRTTLQRVKSGDRLPSKKIFNSLTTSDYILCRTETIAEIESIIMDYSNAQS